jgi:hypothetical protein
MLRMMSLVIMSLVAVCVLAACHHAQAAELRDLRDLDELRTLVDRDKNETRVVLLLSPT